MNAPQDPPRDSGTEHESAVQRLAQSRLRLQKAWRRSHRPDHEDEPSHDGSSPSLFSLLASAGSRWWRRHPLRLPGALAARVAAPAARAALAPTAQQHPLGLLAAAAGVGALLVLTRPWRWLPRAAVSSALLSAVWPRGSLQHWLDAGGRWLASDGAQRLYSGADGPASATTGPPRP